MTHKLAITISPLDINNVDWRRVHIARTLLSSMHAHVVHKGDGGDHLHIHAFYDGMLPIKDMYEELARHVSGQSLPHICIKIKELNDREDVIRWLVYMLHEVDVIETDNPIAFIKNYNSCELPEGLVKSVIKYYRAKHGLDLVLES